MKRTDNNRNCRVPSRDTMPVAWPPRWLADPQEPSTDGPEGSLPTPTAEAHAEPPPKLWPPRPPELAHWSIPVRKRWAALAHDLQRRGVDLWEAERRAFDEIKAARENDQHERTDTR